MFLLAALLGVINDDDDDDYQLCSLQRENQKWYLLFSTHPDCEGF